MRDEQNMGKTDGEISATDEFIAIAAHELQSPLTSLALTLRCLKQDLEHLVDDGRSGHLTKAVSNVQKCEQLSTKLNCLVAKLLEFGKIQSGQLEISSKEVDLPQLVREVIERFDP